MAARGEAPSLAASAKKADVVSSDDFGSGGRTEIADRPPSFYFEALGLSPGKAASSPTSPEAAAPAELSDDAKTDSRQVEGSGAVSLSEPIDIREDSGGFPAPIDLVSADRQEQAPTTAPSPSITEIPMAIDALAAPASASDGAVPLTMRGESSWLDEALKATSEEAAVPQEAPDEPTQESSIVPDSTVPDMPAISADGGESTSGQTEDAGDLHEPSVTDHGQEGGRSGKKLIVVGSLAACLAFAGVYLWMTKPWEGESPAPVAQTAGAVVPTAVAPSPTPEPPPAPPPMPAEPTSPGAVGGGSAAPEEAPAKPAAGAAAESEKKSGSAMAKKSAGKANSPSASDSAHAATPAVAAGEGAAADLIYIVKLKSTPSGAQVFIDGEPMGQTPFQRRILDIDKVHTILIRKPGFDSYERNISKADAWSRSGNTLTLNISPRLIKLRGQQEVPTSSPSSPPPPPPTEDKAESANDQPEKL